MWNSNMELDLRLNKVERMLENYKSTIEPKGWDFIGQHWYDTSTEVLNVWNGRAFTPAYWNSIISTIEGYETRIAQTEYDIAFTVVAKDEVLSAINLSAEWVRIQWSKIRLDWNVEVDWTFTIASLGWTLDNLPDWSTYKRTTANEKTWAGRWYTAINSSNRYQQWLSSADMVSYTLPSTWIVMWSQGIIWRYAWATTFEINAATWSAYFKWAISAESGYINWELIINSSWGLKSSNYDWSNWWLLSNDWLEIWVDKSINVHPGGSIWVWVYWAGPKIILSDWNIELYYSSTSTPCNIHADSNWELIVNNHIEPNSNTTQNLGSSSYSWLRTYSAFYNFTNTGAYFSVWWTAGAYRPIFYNGTWSYSTLYVYQTSSAMWTANRKLRVNVWWIEYWLHAELI